jgi:hypothetical protein
MPLVCLRLKMMQFQARGLEPHQHFIVLLNFPPVAFFVLLNFVLTKIVLVLSSDCVISSFSFELIIQLNYII